MRKGFYAAAAICLLAAGVAAGQSGQAPTPAAAKPDFQMTGSLIEACSCNLFCPCYFNDQAVAAHGGEHYCKFNNVLRVEKGYYKNTRLDGVKVWVSGDLGSEWGQGKADWLVVTFDPSVSKEQQAAMSDILFQLYPLKFSVLGVDSVPIEWKVQGDKAHARLGNGKGEVMLNRFAANNTNPKRDVVIHNLKYWGAQSNTGFRMWKNQRHAYEGHGKQFEFSGTNGFLITITFSGMAKQA